MNMDQPLLTLTAKELIERYKSGERYFAHIRVNEGSLNNAILDGADFSGSDLSDLWLDSASFVNADLSEARMVGSSCENTNFTRAQFRAADLSGTSFERAILIESSFRSATLWTVNFANSDLSRADLVRADCKRLSFTKATLGGARLDGVNCRAVSFVAGNLAGASLVGADLQEADLSSAVLTSAVLCKANLRRATLHKCNLSNADLKEANLSCALAEEAVLDSAKMTSTDCRNADFSGSSMIGAQFDGARLEFANLSRVVADGVDFFEADLTGARIVDAKLPGADFSSASIDGADFQNTDLCGAVFCGASGQFLRARGADLSQTNLSKARFPGSDFSGANLKGAILNQAVFSSGNLDFANLESLQAVETDLRGVHMQHSFVIGATFNDALMEEADLSGSYVRSNRFTRAKLAGTILSPSVLGQNLLETDYREAHFDGGTEAVSTEKFGHFVEPGALNLIDTPSAAPLFAVVRVFYATNRAITKVLGTQPIYGSERASKLSMGVCDVSIPREHRMGELESPSVWRFEFRQDPTQHIVVLRVCEQSSDSIVEQIGRKAFSSQNGDVLIFIHGFNVTFEDATRRTAQLSYDLAFDGAPILFSWPSQGSLTGYVPDEATASAAITPLEEVVSSVLRIAKVKRVHFVAHSLGSRILAEVLANLVSKLPADQAAKLTQVVFAAPDEDSDRFHSLIDRLLGGSSGRVTLYSSSNDEAMSVSHKLHGAPRVGESGQNIFLLNGVDTIDASSVDTSFLGHSYYGSRSVISDLFYVVRHSFPPDQRAGLVRADAATLIPYWKFRE